MTWIKICGITNLEDARVAVEAGADAVGFVFWEKSPRNVTPDYAREIVSQLPQTVEKVGVFVNQFEDAVCDLAAKAGVSAVQLHGDDEDPHVADLIVKRNLELKILVAISMNHPTPEGWAMMWNPDSVHAFIVDSGTQSKPGGTGARFDWQKCKRSVEVISYLGKIVAAGGLTSANVGEAIRTLSPWGVDVSSGVEARPGKKDHDKIRAFVAAVREADRNQ